MSNRSDLSVSQRPARPDREVRIGPWTFPTKKAAETWIRQMMSRQPLTRTVEGFTASEPLAGEDETFVRALVDLHPRKTVITGSGVRHFFVQQIADALGRPCRRLIAFRTDRTIRDFAWRYVLYPRNAQRKLASVLRFLIAPQVRDFRDHRFRGVCECCARTIPLLDCHVDHAPPQTFEELMRAWLEARGLAAEDVDLLYSSGYQQPDSIADPILEESWREHHQIHARLRSVCRDCNLSKLRRKGAHA